MNRHTTIFAVQKSSMPIFFGLFSLTFAFSLHAKFIVTVDKVDGDLGSYSSLSLDTSGNPVISYFDENNGDLKLVHCNDANCEGGDESVSIVDSTGGTHSSLVLDDLGHPVISYYDPIDGDLKLARCNDANCEGGDESIVIVDSVGDLGMHTSLELDADQNPVISYYDDTNGDLKLAHCNDRNCEGDNESIVIVETTGDTGEYTSLELNSSGVPVISYYDRTNNYLKIANCTDVNCAGERIIVILDDGGGEYNSLALDAQDIPVVSFYHGLNGDLKLVRCDDPMCKTGDLTTVDSTNDVGSFSSLVLDSANNPVISYYDDTNDHLKLVRCNSASCNEEKSISIVDKSGGTYISLALDESDLPVISYYDQTNKALKLVRCDDRSCSDANRALTAKPGGPYQGYEGLGIVLDGTGSHDPDDDLLNYLWKVNSPLCLFDDDSVVKPTLRCSDNGLFTVELTVNDGHVDSPSVSTQVTVVNQNPTCEISSLDTNEIKVGDTITAVGTAKDAGASDTIDVHWDFGDGTIIAVPNVKSPFTHAHRYDAAGTFPISFRVVDDDGGSCKAAAVPVTVESQKKRRRDDERDDSARRMKRSR